MGLRAHLDPRCQKVEGGGQDPRTPTGSPPLNLTKSHSIQPSINLFNTAVLSRTQAAMHGWVSLTTSSQLSCLHSMCLSVCVSVYCVLVCCRPIAESTMRDDSPALNYTALCVYLMPMTHAPENGATNRLRFLAPRFFVPYAARMRISGAKVNMTESDVDDEFVICNKITTRKHIKT